MKVILMMEMPENCQECQLHLDVRGGSTVLCCGCDCENMERNILPDWCPLVPMPEKKQNACSHGFAAGWNACLDVIEGSRG